MELLKNTLSVARYYSLNRIDTEHEPDNYNIRPFPFRPIDESADESSAGLVDLFDAEKPTDEGFRVGHLVFFRVRIDTRTIKPSVLNRHFEKALAKKQTELEKQGRNYVSKDEKKEIKEQVRLRLLPKIEPAPEYFMIVVGPHEIWVTSTKSAHLDFAEMMLTRILPGKQIIPATAYSFQRWHALWERTTNGDDLPTNLTERGATVTRYFLSELYRRGELEVHGNGAGSSGGISIKDKITLVSHDDSMTVKSPQVAEWDEVLSRLKAGMEIEQARLEASGESGDYTLVLKEDGTVSSLKTPKMESAKDDESGALLEKSYMLGEVFSLLDRAAPLLAPVEEKHTEEATA